MTAEAKTKLISKLAESYDIAAAAKAAGVTAAEARDAIKSALPEVDAAVLRRVLGSAGEVTKKAIDEFSSIAFGASDDYKVADKMRAIEGLLRLIPEERDGKSERLTVVYDYK